MSGKTLAFGVGMVYADETPFGIIQNVTVDITASVKQLYGENIFPEAIGVGTHAITGSAAFAKWNTDLLPKYAFGTEMASGNQARIEEAGAIPSVTPFTEVVTQAATYLRNIGVIDVASGNHMKRVDTGPATGQYSVNETTGTYTFAVADAGKAIIVRYDSQQTTGQSFQMVNRRMGQQYPFTLSLANDFQGNAYAFTLYQCVFTKLGLAFKNDDFGVPTVEFQCFTNDAGVLGRFDFQQTT